MAVRTAMHKAGTACLTQLLRQEPPAQRSLPCPCGQTARYRGMRSKPILTAVGEVQMLRAYYLCPHCRQGQFPADRALGVEHTELSPGVRRMLGLVGSECSSFRQGREQMHTLAGLEVTTKAVERVAEALGSDIAGREQAEIDQAMQLDLPVAVGAAIPVMYVQIDSTGVPVVRKETAGRAGRNPGEPPRTRDVKLGCVFTQTGRDRKGRPIRNEDSTTYTGAVESASEFGRRIYAEAHRRGWNRARKKVVMGDGADWIWNTSQEQFPGATEIVDLYHARQHLWDLGAGLHPSDEAARRRWIMKHQPLLDEGKIEKLVAALRTLRPRDTKLAEHVQTQASYFETNAARMRYAQFRRQGLFVGTGVVEAGCKTVIGDRLKRSGMFWTVRGANAIIALRCCRLSGKFEDYWEARQR